MPLVLLFSLALHLIIGAYWSFKPPDVRSAARQHSVELIVERIPVERERAPVLMAEPVAPDLDPEPAKSAPAKSEAGARDRPTPVDSDPARASFRADAVPRERPRLDLSLPRDNTSEHQQLDPDSGAGIFDPRLRSALDKARRHSRPGGAPLPDDPPMASFGGGQWEEFLEVDGLCFRLLRADPLDAMGIDQWFPIDCR